MLRHTKPHQKILQTFRPAYRFQLFESHALPSENIPENMRIAPGQLARTILFIQIFFKNCGLSQKMYGAQVWFAEEVAVSDSVRVENMTIVLLCPKI